MRHRPLVQSERNPPYCLTSECEILTLNNAPRSFDYLRLVEQDAVELRVGFENRYEQHSVPAAYIH